MDNQTITYITQNGKYEVAFEQGATKGVIGWKVRANGDDLDQTFKDAEKLKANAELIAGCAAVEVAK